MAQNAETKGMMLLRIQSIGMCRPGMRLAKNIYNEDGRVLLGKHMELTEQLLRRLKQLGIQMVYIEDALTDDVIVEELLSDETRIKALTGLKVQFRKIMEDTGRKGVIQHNQLGKSMRDIQTMIIDDLSRNEQAMIMLMNMNAADHYLYHHSLNVCIYTTMLGLAHGYSRDELMVLGVGSLLHDVGKTKIPEQLLKKPGSLSSEEFEEVKKHAEYGFQILKDEPNISLLSAHCAYQHHERLNGSGYPRGIKDNEIHEYAKLIGLVDSYDAMISHRVYRSALLPHQAMEIMYGGAGTLYDKYQIELFRDKVAIYPLGITVTLNTGESGVVVDLNSTFAHRPIVR
ncbi:MAG: histidine kinase, partial [Paenibacillus sp. RIFOXYA1_FULL_44_5]